MGWWLYGVVCLSISTVVQAQDGARVVCYLTDANNDLSEDFLTKGNPLPCTHVIYSYAKIDAETNSVNLDSLSNVDAVLRNSPATTMIQIGGDEDGDGFSEVTSTVSRRRQFIQSILSLTQKYEYIRGVSLHWMFPGRSDPPEKRNYVNLAQELRKEYNGTVAMLLPNQRSLIIPGFNLLFLNFVVDFFILPAYDFTRDDALPHTYHHSPLEYPPGSNVTDNSLLSMTKLFIRVGAVSERLVVGIPLFGRLVNADTMQIEDYQLPNNQICRMVAEGGWTEAGDAMTGPLLQNANQIISYDTQDSIMEKVKLAKLLRLGGVMFWTMNMDDWNNTCPQQGSTDNGYLPSITAAYDELVSRRFAAAGTILGATDLKPDVDEPFERATENNPERSTNPPTNLSVAPFAYNGPPIPYPPLANSPRPSYEEAKPAYGGYAASSFSPDSPPPGLGAGPSSTGYGEPSYPAPQPAPVASYQFSPFLKSQLPNIRIIEAGQDIVIEDTQVQINENNYYRNGFEPKGR